MLQQFPDPLIPQNPEVQASFVVQAPASIWATQALAEQ
jgi:hypothetical protein